MDNFYFVIQRSNQDGGSTNLTLLAISVVRRPYVLNLLKLLLSNNVGFNRMNIKIYSFRIKKIVIIDFFLQDHSFLFKKLCKFHLLLFVTCFTSYYSYLKHGLSFF
jgi:hypothetical protein